jgi:NAD(P)H-dependent FMN reductase
MITIISGTNRKGSKTLKVAKQYQHFLKEMKEQPNLLSLENIDLNKRTPAYEELENKLIIPADKFIFILPEYNGSFSGAVKMWIDLSRIDECWYHKKVLLTGIADGRAGNLRGMDHFTGVLHYLKMNVHHNKLPISAIRNVMNGDGIFTDKNTIDAIHQQLEEFLFF